MIHWFGNSMLVNARIGKGEVSADHASYRSGRAGLDADRFYSESTNSTKERIPGHYAPDIFFIFFEH